jgi:hypothetical protein
VTRTSATVAARVRRLVPSPLRRAAARVVADRRAADVDRRLARLAAAGRPIALGPWLGEVGFELLYWVPFVRWFAERYDVTPDRLIAVTRGGASSWYAPIASRSFDALTVVGPDDFRVKNSERTRRIGEQKQVRVTALEEDLLAMVRRAEGQDVEVLHPSVMYYLFAPYWWGHRPLAWIERRARHVRLDAPAIAIDLPRDYTAVKFYFNDCFTNTPAHRAFVERTIRELADEGPVISLSTGLSLDDHAACEPDVAAIRGIRHLLAPDTNLLVQSAVVARARRFVGTYGGFAYLAPFYGVPAVSYYTHPGTFSVRHLDLAQHVIARMAGASGTHASAVAGNGDPGLLQAREVPA